MQLSLKKKLIGLGILSVTALSFSSFMSYQTNLKLHYSEEQLNEISEITTLNNNMNKTRLQLMTTRFEAIYQYNDHGKVDDNTLKALKERKETLKTEFKHFVDKNPDFIAPDVMKEAQTAVEGFMVDAFADVLIKNPTPQEITALVEESNKRRVVLRDALAKIDKDVHDEHEKVNAAMTVEITKSNNTLWIVTLSALALLIPLLTLIIMSITRPLRKISTGVNSLSEGDYSLEIANSTNADEIGQLTRGMIELRGTVEKSVRQQVMIDNLSLPVMLCDKDYKITYANQATLTSLKKLERLLPVSVDKIIGSNIDIFHKRPAHQRSLLADRSKLPHQAKFPIGDEWLYLNANALPSKDGTFQGAFIDWRIITDEVRNEQSVKLAQEKINELIAAATKGDLEKRIDAAQFEGFYKELAQSMNSLMNTIVEPINKSISVLAALAHGNLTVRMDGEYAGSFAAIRDALDATTEKLYEMVKQIIESAQAVNSAASEIASGSTDLSQRTEEQASSLEETAASMEQITGTVKQNSTNAATANDLSNKANSVASDGGRVVSEAVTAMSSIEKSSQKISDIIGVIDEIAFQTNLLALNAAVEAARAGDAGKGFAVVASEVRSLAGRSASASKEIKALINESAQQVKNGAALVNQAGETLKGIVGSVQQVAGIVSEIAAASKEQATGIDEINTAITQMDEVTQQNAALVEENTAAAQSMVEQARELEKLMSFFTLDEDSSSDHGNHEVISLRESKAKLTAVNTKPVQKRPVISSGNAIKKPIRAAEKPAKSAKAVGHDSDWKEF